MKKSHKIGLSLISVAIFCALFVKFETETIDGSGSISELSSGKQVPVVKLRNPFNEEKPADFSGNSLYLESDLFDTSSVYSDVGSNKEFNSNMNVFSARESDIKVISNTPIIDISAEERQTVEVDKETKENAIKLVKNEPISTFSVDTDDGSYKLFKQYIENGNLIDHDAVRIEEFINAFNYDYDKPESLEKPFTSEIEVLDSPWSDNKLVKIGVQGYEVTLDSMPSVNLTFLVDVSGSMSSELPKIKEALKMLVNKLRPEDRISLVTYAGNTRVVLSNIEIKNKRKIINSIDDLYSGGGTNGEGGIYLAYKENESGFIENGINRILLISDGDFNVGTTRTESLKDLIKEKRKSGITFSTIGISSGHYSDQRMEQMANVGNGNYTFISSLSDAREVFAERFISTLVNVAKDVKFQVEFNPDVVKEYRLIGYENRMLRTEDFNNDKIDAGEIPSGISATALYEITMIGQEGMHPESRYAKKVVKSETDFSNEIAFLKIRYKKPNEKKSKLIQFPIDKRTQKESLTESTQLAVALAGFAQIYKDSDYVSSDYTYNNVIKIIESIKPNSERVELLDLVKNTQSLKENK